MAQVDGNTDNKRVQDTFIDTLVETMKGENFPVFHQDVDDGVKDDTDIRQVNQEKRTTSSKVAEHVVTGLAVPRQNGHLPNETNENNNNRRQHLSYDVRNMYAQIGSYANDPTL